MAITNYGELKASISNWLDRDDLTARIPEFISQAEDRVSHDLRIRPMETSADISITTSRTAALPTRFLGLIRLYLEISSSDQRRLEYMTPQNFWLRELVDVSGTPKIFTIEGENFVWGPLPDKGYTAKCLYFQRFAALSSDSDTNWLLTNARNVLLYAALIESAPFLEDDTRALTWGAMYDDAIQRVKRSDRRDRYPEGELIMRSNVQVDGSRRSTSTAS